MAWIDALRERKESAHFFDNYGTYYTEEEKKQLRKYVKPYARRLNDKFHTFSWNRKETINIAQTFLLKLDYPDMEMEDIMLLVDAKIDQTANGRSLRADYELDKKYAELVNYYRDMNYYGNANKVFVELYKKYPEHLLFRTSFMETVSLLEQCNLDSAFCRLSNLLSLTPEKFSCYVIRNAQEENPLAGLLLKLEYPNIQALDTKEFKETLDYLYGCKNRNLYPYRANLLEGLLSEYKQEKKELDNSALIDHLNAFPDDFFIERKKPNYVKTFLELVSDMSTSELKEKLQALPENYRAVFYKSVVNNPDGVSSLDPFAFMPTDFKKEESFSCYKEKMEYFFGSVERKGIVSTVSDKEKCLNIYTYLMGDDSAEKTSAKIATLQSIENQLETAHKDTLCAYLEMLKSFPEVKKLLKYSTYFEKHRLKKVFCKLEDQEVENLKNDLLLSDPSRQAFQIVKNLKLYSSAVQKELLSQMILLGKPSTRKEFVKSTVKSAAFLHSGEEKQLETLKTMPGVVVPFGEGTATKEVVDHLAKGPYTLTLTSKNTIERRGK